MGWAKNVARTGTGEVRAEFWWRYLYLRERDHLENLVVVGTIIIKWMFKKWVGEAWTGLLWLRIRTGRWLLGRDGLD